MTREDVAVCVNPVDLSARCRLPELMDSPDLEPARHRQALRALRRINRLSRAAAQLMREIEPLARRRPIRVLDLACGGGDVALALQRLALRRGLPIEVAGCDISETALAHAKDAAAEQGLDVAFFHADLEAESLPEGFDVACCTLFLHHLDEHAALRLLKAMSESCELVLVQDLLRTRSGWWLSQVASRLLTTSEVVRIDAPLSVRAALSLPEARRLAARAGLEGAAVRRIWPQRFSLSWRRPS